MKMLKYYFSTVPYSQLGTVYQKFGDHNPKWSSFVQN